MIDNGATPLLVASQRRHADVTQLLCRVRADIDKEVNDGATDIEKSSTSKLWEQKPIILKQ
jgi:ankyrin repeat protein